MAPAEGCSASDPAAEAEPAPLTRQTCARWPGLRCSGVSLFSQHSHALVAPAEHVGQHSEGRGDTNFSIAISQGIAQSSRRTIPSILDNRRNAGQGQPSQRCNLAPRSALINVALLGPSLYAGRPSSSATTRRSDCSSRCSIAALSPCSSRCPSGIARRQAAACTAMEARRALGFAAGVRRRHQRREQLRPNRQCDSNVISGMVLAYWDESGQAAAQSCSGARHEPPSGVLRCDSPVRGTPRHKGTAVRPRPSSLLK